MKNKSKDPIFDQHKPWENNDNNIWLASSIKLYRNIEKFKFPGKLNSDQRKQIVALINKNLPAKEFLAKPEIINAENATPLEKEYLVEHFLLNHSFQQAHAGEAFIVDSTGEFLMTVNVGNHIEMQLLDSHGDLENTWNRLVKIETLLGKSIAYSYSPTFGFLTANPNKSGTALHATVFLQPSALIHTGEIGEILERHTDETLSITGMQGDPETIIGDIFAVENNYSLGVSEENIISALRVFTTKLLAEESNARTHLRQDGNPDVKDKISRAFGVLMHSYQIETIETLDAITLLKLGADLGWLQGTTAMELNKLFFNCRRAHLLSHDRKEIDNEQLLHKRAEFIHKTLKNVTLTIE